MWELLRKQKELNDYIIETRGLKFNDGELLKNMILACHDEISEVEEAPYDAEEYIDVLHFVLSIALEFGFEDLNFTNYSWYPNLDTSHDFLRYSLLKLTRYSKCFKHWSDKKPSEVDINHVKDHLEFMIHIIYVSVGILDKDMYAEYNRKYQINIERQKNGY